MEDECKVVDLMLWLQTEPPRPEVDRLLEADRLPEADRLLEVDRQLEVDLMMQLEADLMMRLEAEVDPLHLVVPLCPLRLVKPPTGPPTGVGVPPLAAPIQADPLQEPGKRSFPTCPMMMAIWLLLKRSINS